MTNSIELYIFLVEFDGLILSPTREKLEPTIPRKNDEIVKHKESHSQKSSPKKESSLRSSAKKCTQKSNSKQSESLYANFRNNN